MYTHGGDGEHEVATDGEGSKQHIPWFGRGKVYHARRY